MAPIPPSSPRLLLTGFEPFAHFPINPSGQAAMRLGMEFAPNVVSRVLPVDYFRARTLACELMREFNPRLLLATGLATGDEFRIERRARRPTVFTDLPPSLEYPNSMRTDVIEQTLNRLSVPWRHSDDAGQYVCESTYFAMLHHAILTGHQTQVIFLHVPAESEQFRIDRTVNVLREVVRELLAT